MVVAGTEVLMEEAQVPATNLAKALKAVPFTLEDQLAQDVDVSHFAFGSRLDNGNIPVAVIARSGLQWIQEMAASVKLNLQEMLPEALALPLYNDVWTVMTNSGHASVRLSTSKGFSCDTEMLPMLLSNSIDITDSEVLPEHREELIDEEFRRAAHFSCARDEYELHPDNKPEFIRTEVALFAKGLSQRSNSASRINLLQGDYGKSEAMGKAWKPWRLPAALAAMLVALWGGTSFLQYKSLGAEVERIKAEQVSHLKRVFPNAKNPELDPVRQMRGRLKGNQDPGIDNGSFIPMMSAIGKALGELSSHEVTSINYKRGQLDIQLKAANVPEVEKLTTSLESEKKFVARVQSTTREKDGIKARVRVESSS